MSLDMYLKSPSLLSNKFSFRIRSTSCVHNVCYDRVQRSGYCGQRNTICPAIKMLCSTQMKNVFMKRRLAAGNAVVHEITNR